jgi:uncharacterized iron-regulated membrane protein
MKRIFTFVLAALIALTFSVVGFAQEKPAAGTDQGAAATQPEKKAPEKKAKKAKKTKKAKKAKKEEAPAAAPAAEAPAK